METKHTKGEWHLTKDLQYVGTTGNNRKPVCKIVLQVEKGESEANGKIISAAPNNLEDNIEWVAIHNELVKSNIVISKSLSDRIMEQVIKSKASIEKSTK